MEKNGESKALQKEDARPEVTELTLYSMRFCPYALRIRALLNLKKIPYNVVNIDYTSKPDWYFGVNPHGKVPSLAEPGKGSLYESLIVCEYLDEEFEGAGKIMARDPHDKAQQRLLIDRIMTDTLLPAYRDVRMKDGAEHVDKLVTTLDKIENMLQNTFLTGDTVGFVDLMVWPWFEHLPSLIKVRGGSYDFSDERHPKLKHWMDALRKLPAIKAVSYPEEVYVEYFGGATEGKMNPDVGLGTNKEANLSSKLS